MHIRRRTFGSGSVGQLAPAATLDPMDGKRIDLNDLYGRNPIYLKFWATWCVPRRQQMPHFQATFRKYEQQIQVVAVNFGLNDEPADVRRFLEQTRLAMSVAILERFDGYDPKLARALESLPRSAQTALNSRSSFNLMMVKPLPVPSSLSEATHGSWH